MKRYILFTLLVLAGIQLLAQKADLAKSDAIMAEGTGDYAKAAELYKNAVDLYSSEQKTDTFCIFKAGQNYVRVKNYSEGIKFLEQAKKLNYQDKNLCLYLANGYAGIKRYNEAVDCYKKGMEMYPGEKSAYLKKLAYLYYNTKKYNEAINTIDEALTLLPDNTKLLYMKGNALGKLNDYDKAIEIYKKIQELEPGNTKVTGKIGVMYFKKTDAAYKKEVKRYEKLKNPDRVAYSKYRKNIENISTGFKDAIPYLVKALQTKPDDKLLLNCLMVSYSRLGMKEKANEIKAKIK
jgi:tetratricopeptide (TPR) repeat protein